MKKCLSGSITCFLLATDISESAQFKTKRQNHGKKITNIIPSESLSLVISARYPSSEVRKNFFATRPSNQSNRSVRIKNRRERITENLNKAKKANEVMIEIPDITFG